MDPAVGGAIGAFHWRGQDVLRTTPDAARAAGDVHRFACYPLIPYSNRIADATLRLRDRTYSLARNFGDHPHAIHGVGWQRAWTLEASSAVHATMTLVHEATAEWPFPFRAIQTFALNASDDDALLMATLSIENTGARAFPFGLGFHPFFPRDAATRLGFRARAVWETDPTCLPTKRVAIATAWQFDPPRALGDTTLDNVFTGWDGRASLAWPDRALGVTLEADRACDHLVVYVPESRDFLAIEPVTHMTDAFNRDARGERGTGTRMLGQGEAYSCTMRIVASTIPS